MKDKMKLTESKLRQIIRSVIREETEYQKFFKKELEKTGKSIPQMSDEEKKAFFNKIDKAWKGKGESVDELTKAQEKLPPALKKAIQKKEKKESVNEAKVIVYNEKTGERYEVLSGKAKGDLLIAMKALQSSAPSHMKYSIKESVNEVKKGATVVWVGSPFKSGSTLVKKGDTGELVRQDYKDLYLVRFNGKHIYAIINKNFKVEESVNEAKFDASAYKPAPEWKNKMQQRSEFGNLLSPNDVKFLVNSQTKTFTKGNNLIVTDGNRWMIFNTSSPVSKVKRLGNAPQSIKDLHSNS